MIFIDTSFYISLFITTDANHSRAKSIYAHIRRKSKSTSEDFLKETLTVVSQRLSKTSAVAGLQHIRTTTQITPVTTDNFESGLEIFLRPHLNKNISLIDCVAVAVYKDLKASSILTFDRHFKSLGLKLYPTR